MQKEKVDIDGEKGAQISIVAKKILVQGWSEIIVMKYNKLCIIFAFHFLIIIFILC